MKDSTHMIKTGVFGVLSVALLWVLYFAWARVMPEAIENELEMAEISRNIFYMFMQFASVVTFVFTSLFYYLWGKK